MSPVRSDDGVRKLEEVAALLCDLNEQGEQVRIIGTSIVTRSARLGWSVAKQEWIVQPFPKR